jgi:hypothetical protein
VAKWSAATAIGISNGSCVKWPTRLRPPAHQCVDPEPATLKIVPDFKLPLYGADTERGDLAP